MLHPAGETLRAREPSIVDARFDVLSRQVKARRLIRRTLSLALQSLAFAVLAAAFFFRAPQVEGRSMLPTIPEGSHVLINALAFRFGRTIGRGDVVAFERGAEDDRRLFLKRVVGLPGDRLSIRDGQVSVNGALLPEPFSPILDRSNMAALTVPTGAVFVLGDDRPESDDSREFGAIPIGSVVGKAALIVWPPGDAGQVR